MSSPRPRPLAGAPVSSRRSAPSAPMSACAVSPPLTASSAGRACSSRRAAVAARAGRHAAPGRRRGRVAVGRREEDGTPLAERGGQGARVGLVEPVDGRARDARVLERADLGARRGMQAAGDDEPRAPSGIGAADPAWPRCRGGECASPAEPARITSGDAMTAAASASRSASVSASAAMMPPAARRSAAAQGRAPDRAHSRATGGARAARRRGAGCPSRPRCRRDTRGRARSPRCGRGARPREGRRRRRCGPAAGKLGHTSAVGRARHLEEGLDLRGDGAAERGVDLLEDEPGADPARGGRRATARTRAPASDGESARLSVSTTATARVASTRVASTNTPTLPRPEKCAPASQAPVRSSAMSVMVMRS